MNTWFDSPLEEPALLVERWHDFHVQIGSRTTGHTAAAFAEPAFKPEQNEVELRVSFFSRDLDFDCPEAVIRLPRVGTSSMATVKMRPRRPGACRLEIVLSLLPDLDVLQDLGVEVQAVPDVAIAVPRKTSRTTDNDTSGALL